jgi:ABC-type spermidine/putrescine transport system permease subunit II
MTGLVCVFLVLPLLVVILFSFHATAGLAFPFQGFSTRWYESVLSSPDFRRAAANSAIVAVAAALSTLVFGTAAAYGISRSSSRWRTPAAILFLLPISLPGLFLGISLLVFFAQVDLQLSLGTVVLAHIVFVFPFFFLLARTAIDRLDPALEEAAADLGATPWLVFTRVTLPQVWPVLLAAACLVFALSFDEFVITFFVIGVQTTIPLLIWSMLRRTIDPSINVVSTLLLVVTLLAWLTAFALSARGRRTTGRDELLVDTR